MCVCVCARERSREGAVACLFCTIHDAQCMMHMHAEHACCVYDMLFCRRLKRMAFQRWAKLPQAMREVGMLLAAMLQIKQTDRETDRQTDRETERHRDRQTQTDRRY